MKKFLSIFATLVVSGLFANPVSAFTVVKDGDVGNFAKNIPTPTFNIIYEKVGISKPGATFSKTNGSVFNAGIAEDSTGNRIFGVQMPFSALPNHINALYTLNKGDNPISGSYSFLFPDSVRDNYGNYYDLRISESNIKIGAGQDRSVRGTDWMTLFSVDRALVSRSNNSSVARIGLGQQGNFTITVEKNGNPVEGTFIFSARDLDIPDHITESAIHPNYAGPYSESIQDINNTVSKAYLTNDSTIRAIGNNRLVGSTSNNDTTYRSGFAFLANSAQVVHIGISGTATGVPILLERSFSSFEQTSSNGGTISATSRGKNYDSVSGRLITIPSATDGSNAVVYTMTPDSCRKAKSITLSIQTTSGDKEVSQIEVANLAEHPVENLSLNESTGVLTYTYPNTSDAYRRYAIHVEWEEKANCPASSTNPTTPTTPTNPTTPTSPTAPSIPASPTTTVTSTISIAPIISSNLTVPKDKKVKAPNTGSTPSSKDSSSFAEAYLGAGTIGILLLLMIIRFKKLSRS